MKQTEFDKLLKSVRQAGDIKAGKIKPSRVFKINASAVKEIRDKMKLSQPEFANLIGVSVKTIRNWEQGRRNPTGPAEALLRVVSKNPKAVLQALHI